MTIEEKAKRYDEAIEIAKEINNEQQAQPFNVMTKVFPELAESEDERIRKELIAFLKENHETGRADETWSLSGIERWIALLEKQGEQKPADKVEPKFKVGDYVVGKYISGYISEVRDDCYLLDYQGFPIDKQDNYHLWTIQDAKDGDVLACESGWTCIFKTLVNDENFSSYCFMDNTKWFCETGSECHTLKEEFVKAYNGKIYPATKEQRDLLFQKMEEAGYEWDAEKKELKKIEQEPAENKGMNLVEEKMTPFQKKVFCIIDTTIEEEQGLKQVCDELLRLAHYESMQKPAWSEEDERIMKWLICTLKSLNNSPVQIDGAYEMMLPAIAWLEKQGEQKPADKVEPKFHEGPQR